MLALIISLVVLVLVAIGIVLRLLVLELKKPATSNTKTSQKAVPIVAPTAAPVLVGAASVAAPQAAETVVAPAPPPEPAPVSPPEPAPVSPPEPAPVSPPEPRPVPQRAPVVVAAQTATPLSRSRSRKARMRDIVERGEGVRIGGWRRLRSAFSLVFIVVLLGAGSAAFVGAIIVLIALTIQQALG